MKAFPNALLLTAAYALGATLWVFLSNELLLRWLGPGDEYYAWQTWKGLIFVVISTLLLYLFLRLQRRLLDDQLQVRRQHENRLRQSAAVFDNTLEGVVITNTQNRIIHVNRAFERITGYTEAEVLGKAPSLFKSGRHDRSFYNIVWGELQARGSWSGEIWNRRKNGEIFPQWQRIHAIRNEFGELTHYVAIFSDISAMKQSQQELDHLAHHDPLTGLPNRLLFNERVQHALERHAKSQQGG